MIKAIIFDMDGVLFDTEIIYTEKRRAFFKKHHLPITDEQLKSLAGLNSIDYLKSMYPEKNQPTINNLIDDFKNFEFENQNLYIDTINQGTIKLLTYLEKENIDLILASSSPKDKINHAVDSTNIRKYFNHLLSGEDFKKRKPSPEIYLQAIDLLDYDTDHILAVEDSTYGIQSAKSAGLKVICKKDNRFNYNQNNCDYYIDDLIEIIPILEQLKIII